MQSKLKKIISASILGFTIFNTHLFAQQSGNQISSLIQSGQFENALISIANELKNNPNDALLKFQKGIALSGLNRNDEAIAEFSKLTEDYPQLPEPYNNLAVLYSAKGELEKAKASLELAIKSQPNYVTAYDNLGDIYLKLASQYYEKAYSLDANHESAKSKVILINPITNLPIGSKQVYNNKLNAGFPAVPPNITTAEKTYKAKSYNDDKEKTIKKSKNTNTDGKNIMKTPLTAEQESVIKAVNSWGNAWSNKNFSNYLAYYSSSFIPENGDSKSKWEESRKLRIQDKGNISVTISNPQVEINGDSAVIKFKQHYKSDKFNDITRKTLNMIKVNGQWQIKQEKGN